MTIRIQHLNIQPDPRAYLRAPVDGVSMLTSPAYNNVLLSLVRHIMREERCDIIPVVVAATGHPVNRYGHNVQIEVTYDRAGYRAIFAGHYDGKHTVSNVQCYMD